MEIDPHTALEWIADLGSRCKLFLEVAHELHPHWEGWALADGKTIFIKGIEHSLLLTADAPTQDIPTALLAPGERKTTWQSVLTSLRDDLGYPFKGLTIDGDRGLFPAARRVFPHAPIQLCLRHAGEAWTRYFLYEYKGSRRGVAECMDQVADLLTVRALDEKDDALRHWHDTRSYFLRCGLRAQVERVEALLPFYFAFLDHPGMPPTTNIIEGIIRQLSRKIHDIDGYERPDNAWNSLTLLLMRYRFHSFECSRIAGHNGHSPLELAGVSTKGIRWIEFSQRST